MAMPAEEEVLVVSGGGRVRFHDLRSYDPRTGINHLRTRRSIPLNFPAGFSSFENSQNIVKTDGRHVCMRVSCAVVSDRSIRKAKHARQENIDTSGTLR